jgi:hypothetical protein
MHEDVRADYEVSRSEYMRRRELLHIVQEKTSRMEEAVNKHTKLKHSVVDSIKSMVDVSLEAMRRDREHSMKSILHAAEQMMYIGNEASSNNDEDAGDRRNKSAGDRRAGGPDRGRREGGLSRSASRSSASGALGPVAGSKHITPRPDEAEQGRENDDVDDDSKLWSNKHSSSYSNKIRARMNMSFSVSKKLV